MTFPDKTVEVVSYISNIFGYVDIMVLINSCSLLYRFLGIIKRLVPASFWQSSSLLKKQVSMCIVSKRVIAFSLPCEIFIHAPILPHQHYNLFFFIPTAFSLLTFHFFPSLAVSSCCLLSSCPFSYSVSLSPPLLFLVFNFLPPSSFFPFLPFFILNATRLLVPISHCV